MSIKTLPTVTASARPGVKSDISPTVLSRWNPDIQASTVESSETTISMLEPIGAGYDGGVTARRIAGALRNIGDRPVTVLINSPGGDFFEGLAIYNLLNEHPAEVTVKILGLAASAASIIAMAGDNVLMGRSSFLMIHNTWVLAAGDRNAFRELADWLEPFDHAAIDIYAARTGQDASKLGAMLDKETWISGTTSVEQNFADGLLEGDEASTKASGGTAPELSAKAAAQKLEILLSRESISRGERRQLLAALKGGTSSAVPAGKPSATVHDLVKDALANLKSL